MAEEVKRENFASVEEAIRGAGTTVLSHLGSNAHKLTRDEVKQYEEENGLSGPLKEGEYRASASPYSEVTDERNFWTFRQDAGETDPPELPDAEEPAVTRY